MNPEIQYLREFRRNAPIEYNGLTLYPLTVDQYETFLSAKPAIELMQGSLPPALARLGWLECLWELDKQSIQTNGKAAGFMRQLILLLAECLRLTPVKSANGHTGYPLRPTLDKEMRITGILLENTSAPTLISKQQAGEIRRIIALQNGYEMPNESWNAELLRESKRGQKGDANLTFSLEDLVYSVAINSGKEPEEVWDWPIRKFQLAQNAIDRRLGYQIFTQAEMTGMVKFNDGNPYPTWKYDRKTELPSGFKTLEELEASTKGFFGDQGAFNPVKTQ